MNAADWLTTYAAELGIAPPDDQTVERLLELAGIAAHSSERIAAPITCWLVGAAGLDVEDALELGRRLSPT